MKKNIAPFYVTAGMNADQCSGAALFLCFLTDLFTMSEKTSFTPAEVVNVLDLLGKRELPAGLVDHVKALADEVNPPESRP